MCCVEARQATGSASEDGVQCLIGALIASGECIAQAGHSRPASGSEHHLSHFWEMRALRAGEPAKVPGAKVGVAAGLIASLYARLAALPAHKVRQALRWGALPARPTAIPIIQAEYGDGAAVLLAEQKRLLELAAAQLERILDYWPEIPAIAAKVPPPAKLRSWLAEADAPSEPVELGLSEEDVRQALELAHYLRPRFRVLELFDLFRLGL